MVYAENLAFRHEYAPRNYSESSVENYIGDLTFADYRRAAAKHFPFILRLIDPDRVKGAAFSDYVELMNEISWEFEDQATGGRGDAYNLAQRNSDNRKIGTLSLLKCFSESLVDIPAPDKIILDVLGGDGTITRFARSEKMQAPTIISADLSGFMVKACLAQKFPCIRQSATQSLLRDSVLDGVLIAYGSHHLDRASRKTACGEAFRTLKNGGRFVLHDFETGTPAVDWFDKVVHPFSRTGHPHPHFSRNEMFTLLESAGFKNIRIFSMPDPFVLKGENVEGARTNALTHLYRMYDLVRIANNEADILHQLETYVRDILGEIQIEQTGSTYTATIQRQALVAVGTKIA
jgi:SAM-dependent methyltransferase